MVSLAFLKVFAILLTVIAKENAHGAVLPKHIEGKLSPNQTFLYLGSMTTLSRRLPFFNKETVSQRQATSYYFLSQNSAGFTTAETDCAAALGDDATLAYIETKEELGNLTRFFASSDDTGSTYWIGGKYNPEEAQFEWGNGAAFGPWLPWDQGHPETQLPVTRVILRRAGGLKFRTQFQTASNRYICEIRTGPVEEEAVPCYHDNDLVIAVDSSGSIGNAHYMVALEFTTRLALAWADNPNNRLSLIIYSNDARTIFSLNDHLDTNQIRDSVYKTAYIGGGTASDLGLAQALREFNQTSRNVPKNLVFLTDGASNDRQKTTAAANALKEAGVRSFSVGIGSGIGVEELTIIAGGNKEQLNKDAHWTLPDCV